MMLPLVAIGIASAIAQYMNSKQGLEASAEERENLRRLLDKIQQPNFDSSDLDPQEYKVLQQFTPQGSSFVEEKGPMLTRADSEGAKAGRDAQMAALQKLTSLSQSGSDPMLEMQTRQALNEAGTANRGRVGAITESFARRGQGGGPQEMLAQLLGSQQSNEMATNSATSLAIEAEKRKLQSLMDSASLGGRIRGEDVQLEGQNNDILNQFNQRFAARKQGWQDNQAALVNDAQKFNIGQNQSAADRNTSTNNSFMTRNQDNRNSIEGKKYDAEMAKLGQQTNLGNMARQDIAAGTQANNSAISGVAGGAMSAVASSRGGGSSAPASASLTQDPKMEGEYDADGNPIKRKYQ